jgi:hypothetical protein
MKTPKNQIEKLIEKHRRIMRMKHLDHGTSQMHYGIFKGLRIALEIIEKYERKDT